MDWTYKNDNENEPLTFSKLGLATIVNRIRNAQALRELADSKDQNRDVVKRDKQPSDSENEQREETERADIERRMLDILHMENTLRRKSRK